MPSAESASWYFYVQDERYQGNSTEKSNVTPEFEMESSFLSTTRKIPGYQTLKKLIPPGLKTALQPLLKAQVTGHLQWNPGLKRKIAQELEPDIHQFLDYCNKPRDYWNLTD